MKLVLDTSKENTTIPPERHLMFFSNDTRRACGIDIEYSHILRRYHYWPGPLSLGQTDWSGRNQPVPECACQN